MSPESTLPRFVREPEVRAMLGGVSHPTIWAWRRRARNPFPAPLKLGPNVAVWPLDEVLRWAADHRNDKPTEEVSERARSAAARSVAKRRRSAHK